METVSFFNKLQNYNLGTKKKKSLCFQLKYKHTQTQHDSAGVSDLNHICLLFAASLSPSVSEWLAMAQNTPATKHQPRHLFSF